MTSGREPASATERDGPPRAVQAPDATSGVVTRLDQGLAERSMSCAGAWWTTSWRATSRGTPRRLPRRRTGPRDARRGDPRLHRSQRRGWARRSGRRAGGRQTSGQPQPGAAVRSEDAGGLRLPGAGDGERAVPDPWRDQHRAAHGGGAGQSGRRPHDERGLLGGQLGRGPVPSHVGGAVSAAGAARQLQAFLPPDVAARLATVPAELSAPMLYSQTAKPEITTKTLRSGGRDARGRFAARARAVPRGRAAELAAARADRAALVPWRAAIAGARLARREALAACRAARIENHDKDRMERLPGACLGGPAGGGHGIGKIAQRPSGQAPEGMPCRTGSCGGMGIEGAGVGGSTLALDASRLDPRIERPIGSSCPTGSSARWQAPAGFGEASLGALLTAQAREREGCVAEGVPAPTKTENGDKDPIAANGAVALGWDEGVAVRHDRQRRLQVGGGRAGHLAGRARGVERSGGGKVVDAAGEPDRLG
jgi:hypothetical protein